VRSRSGRGGGWGAREAHEEEELTGSELAGVFARLQRNLASRARLRSTSSKGDQRRQAAGESPNLTSAESARFAGRSAFVLLQRC
jgi:hypothetical protein